MKKAFSLIEILIYSVILALVVTALLQIFLPIQNVSQFSNVEAEFERNLTFIETTLSYWIRQAEDIVSVSNGYLELKMPQASLDPTKFRLSGTNIEISQGSPDNWQILNSSKIKILELSFEKVHYSSLPPLVTFQIKASASLKGKEITRTIKTTVGLRKGS